MVTDDAGHPELGEQAPAQLSHMGGRESPEVCEVPALIRPVVCCCVQLERGQILRRRGPHGQGSEVPQGRRASRSLRGGRGPRGWLVQGSAGRPRGRERTRRLRRPAPIHLGRARRRASARAPLVHSILVFSGPDESEQKQGCLRRSERHHGIRGAPQGAAQGSPERLRDLRCKTCRDHNLCSTRCLYSRPSDPAHQVMAEDKGTYIPFPHPNPPPDSPEFQVASLMESVRQQHVWRKNLGIATTLS